jgi:heterodisulfide reductase subunit A
MHEKAAATEKAKALVRMAVMNANSIKPLKDIMLDVSKKALVVGGGMAGMTAALNLANQNFEVFLVEQEDALGGNLKHIFSTIDGLDVQSFMNETIEKVASHPLIHVEVKAQIVDHTGFKGNFETGIEAGPQKEYKKINHGIIVLATGGEEYKPNGMYSYGENEKVVTQMELEGLITSGRLPSCERIAMIQCVGSRNEERPYCSRICCSTAIKNAISLKEQRPEADVVILFRDIMTYGFLEKYYLKARRLGIRFIRFEKDTPPNVTCGESALTITCYDPSDRSHHP